MEQNQNQTEPPIVVATKQKISTYVLTGIALVLIGGGIIAYAMAGFIGSAGIKVLSPNGGENITVSENFQIKWQAAINAKFSISLYQNNRFVAWIVKDTFFNADANRTRTYGWQPSNNYVGDNFKIKIESRQSFVRIISDMSDGSFKIVAPSVTMLAPNGGESWLGDSQQIISWSSNNLPSGASVGLAIYKGGVYKPEYFRAYQLPANGTYNWTILNTIPTGSDYTMEVEAYNSSGNRIALDTSDAPFKITAPITVLAPNGGEEWVQGAYPVSIKWLSTGKYRSLNKTIDIYKGDTFVENITTHNGSDSYEEIVLGVRPTWVPGNDYKIKITPAGSNTYDFSDAPFKVVGPITVLTPNGGEEWTMDSNQTITWSVNGSIVPNIVNGEDHTFMITMKNTVDGTIQPILTNTVALNPPSTARSYSFNLPTGFVKAGPYKVRVMLYNKQSVFDDSDAPFNIIASEKYSVLRDPANPYSANVSPGTTNSTITGFKFDAGSKAITINKIKLRLIPAATAMADGKDLLKVYIYEGSNLLSSGEFPKIAAYLNPETDFILNPPLKIPANMEKIVTIKADIASLSGDTGSTIGDQFIIQHSESSGVFDSTGGSISNNSVIGMDVISIQ
jgi:hypothetical protein